MKTAEQARRYFEHHLEPATVNLQKFQEKLAADAAYALEWRGAAFTDAARVKLCKMVLEDLTENDAIVAHIAAFLTKQALREARYPSRSTSPTSNLMAQEWAAVCAEAAEY